MNTGQRTRRLLDMFTSMFSQVDWLIVGGQEVSCGRKAIWAGGFCQSCEAGFQPNTRADRCLPCPLGNAGTDGSCSVCATGTIPDPSRASCETCLPGQTAFAGVKPRLLPVVCRLLPCCCVASPHARLPR